METGKIPPKSYIAGGVKSAKSTEKIIELKSATGETAKIFIYYDAKDNVESAVFIMPVPARGSFICEVVREGKTYNLADACYINEAQMQSVITQRQELPEDITSSDKKALIEILGSMRDGCANAQTKDMLKAICAGIEALKNMGHTMRYEKIMINAPSGKQAQAVVGRTFGANGALTKAIDFELKPIGNDKAAFAYKLIKKGNEFKFKNACLTLFDFGVRIDRTKLTFDERETVLSDLLEMLKINTERNILEFLRQVKSGVQLLETRR